MAEPPASILQGSRDPHIIAETPHPHHPIHQTPLPSSPRATETPTSIIPDSGDPHPHYADTTQPHLHLSTHRRPPTSISPPLPFNPQADAPHRPHFTPCMGVAAFTAGAPPCCCPGGAGSCGTISRTQAPTPLQPCSQPEAPQESCSILFFIPGCRKMIQARLYGRPIWVTKMLS